MIEYVSFEKQLRLDAEVYCRRANAYLETKELNKAIGCLMKAKRKIDKANILKLSPLEEALYGFTMNALSDKIAKQIIEGK